MPTSISRLLRLVLTRSSARSWTCPIISEAGSALDDSETPWARRPDTVSRAFVVVASVMPLAICR